MLKDAKSQGNDNFEVGIFRDAQQQRIHRLPSILAT